MIASLETIRASSSEGPRFRTPADRVLPALGRRLNEASIVREVGEIVLEAAQGALGWDAASLDLLSRESGAANCVVAMDLIDGRVAEVAQDQTGTKPSANMRQVMKEGARFTLDLPRRPLERRPSPGLASRPS